MAYNGNTRSSRSKLKDDHGLPSPEPSSQAHGTSEASKSTPASALISNKELSEEGDDSSESVRVTSVRRSARRHQFLEKVTQHAEKASTSSDDEDVMPSTKPRPRRNKSARVVSPALSVQSSSYESLSARPSPRKRSKPPQDVFVVDDDEVEYLTSEEEPVTPSKLRKLSRDHRSPRTPHRRSARVQEELTDDLANLRDSDVEETATKLRDGPVRTKKDEDRAHFEELKKRRTGPRRPIVDSEEDEEDGPAVNDYDESLGEGNLRIDSDLGSAFSSESEIQAFHAEDAHEPVDEDNDFVVDDSDNAMGAQLPLEFSSHRTARPEQMFDHVIEWLVKNKISPAFNRNDDLWRIAFNKINDELKGQAGSRLISAAWNARFKHTLEARPEIRIQRLPGMDDDHIRTCDACNRTNRPAQYDFQFFGRAYNKNTLEPLNDSDDENSSDQGLIDEEVEVSGEEGEMSDSASVDEKGRNIAKRKQHFYLGSHCTSNAQMGHKLTHWLWHLNQNVLEHLEEQDVLSADAVVKRDKRSHTKREAEAERIVDDMKDAGIIRRFWKDFRDDRNDARLGMADFEMSGRKPHRRIGVVRREREDGTVQEMREQKVREAPTVVIDDSD